MDYLEMGNGTMSFNNADIGLIGLGVMGRNLALNVADRGFKITGFDRDDKKVRALAEQGNSELVCGADSLEELLSTLRKPRAVMMLVPAGTPVDSVIGELMNRLEAGDIVIDGGNSHFTDSNRHADLLSQRRINFIGMGISGGSAGARNGPSMMPGGPIDSYDRVRKIFEAIAAKVDNEPCVAYLGPGSAGHYVKMVHNGIEYALMQLISESYDLLMRAAGLSNDELADTFERWNEGALNSFLIQITSKILRVPDEATDRRLLDEVLDAARQKGTGKWTSQDAMELQVPVPTIDAAVSMRDLSTYKDERERACKVLPLPDRSRKIDKTRLIEDLEKALHFGMIASYSQGMALLAKASDTYNYELSLADVARIWRDGCIIRAALVDHMKQVYHDHDSAANLMTLEPLSGMVVGSREALREVLCTGFENGIPLPAMSSALAYFDAYRTSRLPANLIQAQRDYFGSHGYERIDRRGSFHTDWTHPMEAK